MLIFGLTGSIACGKSTVSRTFRTHGIPMVDADVMARDVVAPGSAGLYALRYAFGDQYIQPDGYLDRVKFGAMIFSDNTARELLDRIMLPLIEERARSQFEKLQQEGYPIIGWDAALLIEVGHADLYRPLIVVQCRELTQISRLMKRNNLTADEAMRRISAQMPTEQKVALADYVINTDGTMEDSVKQTTNIIHILKRDSILNGH